MKPDFELIRELFDLTDSGEGNDKPSTASKVGRDEAQSREFGASALNAGDYETAVVHFKRAVEQSELKSSDAILDLAATYATQDNVPQALRQYLKAKRIAESGELLVGLAALQQQVGRHSRAIATLRRSVELEPKSAYNHYKLAEALRRAGLRRQALESAQVAVACAPDDAFYHYWMGEYLLESGEYAAAQDALHAAIELSPGDDELYFLASQAFWGQGKKQEAVRSIRLANDIDTAKPLYRGLLEAYLRASGLEDEADQERARNERDLEEYDRSSLDKVLARLRIP